MPDYPYIENLTNPNEAPVAGDQIIVHHSAKSQERKTHYEASGQPAEPVRATLYKDGVMDLVRTVASMDQATELAFRKDPNLELLWMQWRDDFPFEIPGDHPKIPSFLASIVQAGYLTEAQRDDLLAQWPVEG